MTERGKGTKKDPLVPSVRESEYRFSRHWSSNGRPSRQQDPVVLQVFDSDNTIR